MHSVRQQQSLYGSPGPDGGSSGKQVRELLGTQQKLPGAASCQISRDASSTRINRDSPPPTDDVSRPTRQGDRWPFPTAFEYIGESHDASSLMRDRAP